VTDGKEIEDFASIAEAFNQHLATSRKNQITAPSQSFSKFLGNLISSLMYIEP